jgi:DNA polymerase-3 subunit alpha
VIACLIKSGACDSLGGHRAQLLAGLDETVEAAAAAQRERESGQSSLFDFAAGGPGDLPALSPIELPSVSPWSLRETLQQEKEQVGFYISGHPMDEYEIDYRSFATSSILKFRQSKNDGREVTLIGEIHRVSRRTDKNGNLMAFFELEDYTGAVECIAFNKTHAAYGQLIQEDSIVLVRGTPNTRNDGDVKCQVNEIFGADRYRLENARFLEITLAEGPVERGRLDALRKTLQRASGRVRVRFVVSLGPQGHQLVLQADDRLGVDPSARILTQLRDFPGIKKLTFRKS